MTLVYHYSFAYILIVWQKSRFYWIHDPEIINLPRQGQQKKINCDPSLDSLKDLGRMSYPSEGCSNPAPLSCERQSRVMSGYHTGLSPFIKNDRQCSKLTIPLLSPFIVYGTLENQLVNQSTWYVVVVRPDVHESDIELQRATATGTQEVVRHILRCFSCNQYNCLFGI